MKTKENSEYLESLIDEAINENKFDSLISYISAPKNKVWEYVEPSNGYSLMFILYNINIREYPFEGSTYSQTLFLGAEI